jgi:hypothetical protein
MGYYSPFIGSSQEIPANKKAPRFSEGFWERGVSKQPPNLGLAKAILAKFKADTSEPKARIW